MPYLQCAKDVSEFDTLAEMKDDIKNKLAEQNEKTATTEFENKLIDQVIANMEGEIPEEMYESRIDEMVRDFDYRLRSQGMDINVYLQYTGMEDVYKRQCGSAVGRQDRHPIEGGTNRERFYIR